MKSNDDSTKVSALKSGVWYTASTFILKTINYFTTPFFVRMMTKEDFGSYNNYTSWLQLITIISTLSLGASVYNAKYDHSKRFDSYVKTILLGITCSTLLIFIVLLLMHNYIFHFLELDRFCIVLMMFVIISNAAIDIFQSVERISFNYKKSVFLSGTVSILSIVLTFLFMYTLTNKFYARILGSALPSLMIGLALYFLLMKKGKEIDFNFIRYAVGFCLPYIPHLLGMTVLATTDRIMITNIIGAEYNALYSLAYTCSVPITVLGQALNSAYSPWLAKNLSEHNHDEIYKYSSKYFILFFPIAPILTLLAPELLLFLGGKEYREAIYVIPPILLGCYFQFLYTIYVDIEQLKKRTIPMAIATCSAAAINFVLNLIFIPIYGYSAAAYTTLAGYILLLISHYVIVRIIGYGKVLDSSFFFKLSIIQVILTTLAGISYTSLYLRICLVVIYFFSIVLIFITKRKSLIKYIYLLKK